MFYNFDDRRFVGAVNGVTKLLVALGTLDTLLPSGATPADRWPHLYPPPDPARTLTLT